MKNNDFDIPQQLSDRVRGITKHTAKGISKNERKHLAIKEEKHG